MTTTVTILAALSTVLGSGKAVVVQDAQVYLIADVEVPAREAGILTEIKVKEGDFVKKDQLLGQIDTKLAGLELQLAETGIQIAKVRSANDVDRRFAKKSLQVAGSELQRAEKSVDVFANSISKTEIDRLRLEVEKTELSLEQSVRDEREAELVEQQKQEEAQIAAERLQRRLIRAPIDGLVVKRFRHSAEWLNPGDPVVRVVQLNPLRVEGFVDANRFSRKLEGHSVSLKVALPPDGLEVEFHGRVVFVHPEVQPVTRLVRVWAEIENTELRLRPGDSGSLVISLDGNGE